MKNKILLPFAQLIMTMLILVTTKTNSQNLTNLYFASYDNIVSLNFSTGVPVVNYTGVANGYEGTAHAEDGFGNVLFYVNANGVYRFNNTLMAGSTGILADPSSTEINICPFPGNPDKFYVFYNAQTCSNLYYCVVDMTLNGGTGDVTNLNTVLDASDFSEGLEVIKNGCDSYWLIAYECNVAFVKFSITSTGRKANGV